MGWISPTSHNDPSSAWADEFKAYNDNEAAADGAYDTFGHGYYLELFHAALNCDKVRINAGLWATWYDTDVDVDVYYSDDWHNIHSGSITHSTWVELPIGSTQSVTGARIKSNDVGGLCYINEFDFWEVENQAPTAPTDLEVDEKSNPTGANCISDLTPGFTAIFNDDDIGDQSNAIEIQVGSASGLSDMWDSGWLADSTIEGNRCTAKTYDGAALSAGTSYWWRCRFRDDDDAEGAWSEWQQFDICAAATLVQMALI